MTIRIGIAGIAGRMGRLLAEEVEAAGAILAGGTIRPGARADLQLLEAPSATHLAYRPGMPLTAAVWRTGERVV